MSFIPEVKMDFIPSDDDEDINLETGEKNPNFIYDEFDETKDKTQEEIQEEKEEEIESIEDVVPKAKSKRDGMDVNEIFNMPIDPNIKLTKKGKPRKQRPPMTEAHKEKLKAARVKAMAARQTKAKERQEAKLLEKQEKELLKQQKVKRVKQLKEEVEEDIKPQPIKKNVIEQMFSKKDLEDAQLNAIMNYEKIRKQRKDIKRKEEKENKEHEKLKSQLRRAVTTQQEYNPFQNCY
tara:strand:+ start:1120 stop:1827 length:708 start_codon:yes stop_codon:yes gene_type:complete